MTIDAYFDSIFCVNLDRRTDRWGQAQAELTLCGIERCRRFQAVDYPLNGPIGCAMSHRRLWRHIATGDLGERVLILEDDFTFVTREMLLLAGYTDVSDTMRIFNSCVETMLARRFATMIDEVPSDWDLLYLGGSYETSPLSRVDKHVIRNNGMHTTHAYGITRAFAGRMTAHLDPHYPPETDAHCGGIDSALASQTKQAPEVFSYTLMPRLFIQRPLSKSDINPNASLGFPFSQVDSAHEMIVSAPFTQPTRNSLLGI